MKLGSLFMAGVHLVTLPVAIIKDVVTLGGVATTGEIRPYTVKKLEDIKDELNEVTE